ncbi:hypothetical protein SLS57_000818 [Botryosphaeria dothidea]
MSSLMDRTLNSRLPEYREIWDQCDKSFTYGTLRRTPAERQGVVDIGDALWLRNSGGPRRATSAE